MRLKGGNGKSLRRTEPAGHGDARVCALCSSTLRSTGCRMRPAQGNSSLQAAFGSMSSAHAEENSSRSAHGHRQLSSSSHGAQTESKFSLQVQRWHFYIIKIQQERMGAWEDSNNIRKYRPKDLPTALDQ